MIPQAIKINNKLYFLLNLQSFMLLHSEANYEFDYEINSILFKEEKGHEK